MYHKAIMLVVGFSLCFQTIYSQSKNTGNIYRFEDKRFFGGLVVAGVASQVDGDYYGGYNKLGVSAGANVGIQVSPLLLLEVGMLYTQKGSRIGKATSTDLGMVIDKYKLNLQYIDIPFSVNYIFSQTYLFGAGLTYSAFMGADESSSSYNGTITYSGPMYRFNRHSSEFFINFAAMANKHLKLSLQYHYSLTPIRRYEYAPMASGNQYNNYFTFGFAYIF